MLFLCMICPARLEVAAIFPELRFFVQNNSSPWSHKPYNRYRRAAAAVADARFVAGAREQAPARSWTTTLASRRRRKGDVTNCRRLYGLAWDRKTDASE